MESPPSCSTWSEVFICSEDSGLLITSGSSCSVSLENQPNHFQFEFQNSDFDDKSLSTADSLDDMSDIMCGENFNTLKKGHIMIDPPIEFQDKPNLFKKYTNELAFRIIRDALYAVSQLVIDGKHKCTKSSSKASTNLVASAWFSPARPGSRNSLGSSNTGRLSCSHSSLATPSSTRHPDDSNFITQAVSICELYSVPLDGGDVYAVPVDVVRNNTVNNAATERRRPRPRAPPPRRPTRRSVAGLPPTTSNLNSRNSEEPIHMTLQEVRQYLQTLYSSSSDSSEIRTITNNSTNKFHNSNNVNNNNNNINKQKNRSSLQNGEKTLNKYKENVTLQNGKVVCTDENTNHIIKNKKNTKSKKDSSKKQTSESEITENSTHNKKCPVRSISSSLKQTLCNLFRWRRHNSSSRDDDGKDRAAPLASRALPPLPSEGRREESPQQPKTSMDFASSIQKVKDYGWYWGPISSEAAERILLNEPDGSFIVRDSSDDHYIFSLTFRLQSGVRHVRIEHDQGNFSFGSCTRFKSHTIVEFIERAVEHSRSGRYLFFLHRRPLLGPMRVQLLHPVSRFKRVQSLQHMCRFVILKQVRKDKISELPLPRRIIDYLNTPHYYAEQLEDPNLNETEQNAPQETDTRAENNNYENRQTVIANPQN